LIYNYYNLISTPPYSLAPKMHCVAVFWMLVLACVAMVSAANQPVWYDSFSLDNKINPLEVVQMTLITMESDAGKMQETVKINGTLYILFWIDNVKPMYVPIWEVIIGENTTTYNINNTVYVSVEKKNPTPATTTKMPTPICASIPNNTISITNEEYDQMQNTIDNLTALCIVELSWILIFGIAFGIVLRKFLNLRDQMRAEKHNTITFVGQPPEYTPGEMRISIV